MKNHSKSSAPRPLVSLLTHPSVIAVGLASAISGIAISSVNAYRYLTADSTPTYTSLRGESPPLSTSAPDSNSLVCLKSDAPETAENSTANVAEQDNSNPAQQLLALDPEALAKKITSSGERMLVDEASTLTLPKDTENLSQKIDEFKENKAQGIKEYADGKYQAAVIKFQAARAIHKNSPESLIYLNNAKASQAKKTYTLAVVVPLKGDVAGTNRDTAMAILKGAAHAQDDINQSGGIAGVPIKLLIIDDFNNNPKSSEAVAKVITQQKDVLGIIGHDASNATAAARKIYQNASVASISPTSSSPALPPGHTFGLRTIPNDTVSAKLMADYMLYQDRSKVAIVYSKGTDDASNQYSQPVQDTIKEILDINDDLEEVVKEINLDGFNGEQYDELLRSLEQSIQLQEIDTIVLLPARSDDSIQKALKLAIRSRELSKNLLILGNEAMHVPSVMDCAYKVTDMVVPMFWHMDTANANVSTIASDFVSKASNPNHPAPLWNTSINWMSATTYDAVLAFSQALASNHPEAQRSNVAKSLTNEQFSMDGVTGLMKFNSSGDRLGGTMKLFKVLPNTNETSGEDSEYTLQPIFFE